MAKTTRNWGFGGTDKHKGAFLPEKRVETIRGFSTKSTGNIGDIPAMLLDAVQGGKTPTQVRYGGARWNTTLFGTTCKGKYYSLNLVHDETMEQGEVEIE
jgi:hypothetical protein